MARPTRHFCTTSDWNYLAKGLAMYQSLERHYFGLKLHWGCIDQKTFDYLSDNFSDDSDIIPYNLTDTIKRKTNYAQHCYTLTPYFTLLIQNLMKSDVTYIDADIYFYNDIKIIFKTIGDRSIGIHTHRIPKYPNTGKYNVGIVHFKYDKQGRECLEFWNDLLTNPDNKYAEEYGMCGDQKYLELFEKKFDSICVFDEEAPIANLASWNAKFHFFEGSNVYYQTQPQQLVFYHFSHFNHDGETWKSNYKGEWRPEASSKFVTNLYDEYFKTIKLCEQILIKDYSAEKI